MNVINRRKDKIIARLHNLDESVKKRLEEIVQTAIVLFKMPVALITLLDSKKQYIEVEAGLQISIKQTPVEQSFCRFTIRQDEIMEIKDSLKDERFNTNPVVTNNPYIRYYAGAPLKVTSGEALGSLCVLDYKPNKLTKEKKIMLEVLSKQVSAIFEFELALKLLTEEMERVQYSEMKLKSVYDSASSAYLLIDKEGIILTFNDKAEKYLNDLRHISLHEGMRMMPLLTGPCLENFVRHFELAITGKKVSFEHQGHYDNNKVVFWHTTLEPVYKHDENIFGIAVNYIDISEIKNFKKDVLRHNKTLKKIADVQSHKYRKPVANILGLISILDDNDCRVNKKVITHLREQAIELDDIIRNITDLTASN